MFSHITVLLHECIDALNIKPDGVYVDCTAGGGGHSLEIAKKLSPKGLLICIDRDTAALEACKERLSDYMDRVKLVHARFSEIKSVLDGLGIEGIDGALMDLGVSSYQIDTAERGFSFRFDAPLDMRMDRDSSLSAYEIVNFYSQQEIADILWRFGEEKFSRKIAEKIVKAREESPIETTGQLVDIIKSAMPGFAKREDQHPAKRSFQALRIAVNEELAEVTGAVNEIPALLNKGGRIAIISFHSLEDRIVKTAYNELSLKCSCPPDFPVCVCNRKPILEVITRKPILPTPLQITENRRAASAKLRVAERI